MVTLKPIVTVTASKPRRKKESRIIIIPEKPINVLFLSEMLPRLSIHKTARP
ncbi:hypothetical protein Z950_219 [Sulfitobacter mediterraneus KCTC 32188]|nr:hypothetical protein Z950_219 [Sulfitobacter mediterraneus KCTC 32188]